MKPSHWLVLLAMELSGCASLQQVGTNRPIRAAAARNSPDYVFGHTVEVHRESTAFIGELIGCNDEAVFVRLHVESGEPYRRFPWNETSRVRVALGGWGGGALAWTLAGTVSSLSHGVFALFSAPIWLIVGSITTPLEWNPGLDAFPPTTDTSTSGPADPSGACGLIRAYARFPQGPPASFLPPRPMPVEPVVAPPAEELPPIDITPTSSAPPLSSAAPTP